MRAFFILPLLIACDSGSSENTTDEVREVGVAYGDAPFTTNRSFAKDQPYGDDPRQVLDLFFDEAAAEPTPLIIYIHGGAFFFGQKEDAYEYFEDSFQELIDGGVAVASINYRLLSLETPDTEGVDKSLADARRALQYLRYYHETFNIDPDRVAIYGHSAGASAAMWLGTLDDMARPNSDDPILRESTRISGFAALETQASLNIARWSEDVFVDYSLDVLIAAEAFGLEDMLLSFYGMEKVEDFYNEEITAYREGLDVLSFMSADDPPMFIGNYMSPEVSMFSPDFDLFHHPYHAREAVAYGEASGMEVVGYAPEIELFEESGETVEDFLLRMLQ